MFRLMTLLCITSILASSCKNCVCLPSEGLRLTMISFTPSDVDTLVIRKFEKGTAFNHLIDTTQWDGSNVVFRAQNDTLEMAAMIGGLGLKSNFDYEVYVPAIGRTYKISDLNEPQREENCPYKTMCVNLIVSAKVDEKTTQLNSDILFLKK